MYKDGDELSYEPSLLVEEALYWDMIEEADDGIPRSYGTLKERQARQGFVHGMIRTEIREGERE